jgi:hypothetical protein
MSLFATYMIQGARTMLSFKSHTTLLSASMLLVLSLLVTLSGVVKADYEMTYCDSAETCITVCYDNQGQFLDLGSCTSENNAEAEIAAALPAASTGACASQQIGTMVVYSTAEDGTPSTLLVTTVSLASLPNITDEELASGQPILISSDGSSTPGLHVVVYWQTHQNSTSTDESCPL